jgi:hypothetical protein
MLSTGSLIVLARARNVFLSVWIPEAARQNGETALELGRCWILDVVEMLRHPACEGVSFFRIHALTWTAFSNKSERKIKDMAFSGAELVSSSGCFFYSKIANQPWSQPCLSSRFPPRLHQQPDNQTSIRFFSTKIKCSPSILG